MNTLQQHVFSRLLLPGLCWLVWSWTAVQGAAQTIEFLPVAPSVYENGSNVTLIVTRTPATGTASVNYTTWDLPAGPGAATAGEDYLPDAGTLDFADGESFKLITIYILNDLLQEGAEQFQVVLSNPVGATLGLSTNTVTIFDDDTFFAIDALASTLFVSEDSTNAHIVVVRTGGTNGSASVGFFTEDPTNNAAIGGLDYGPRYGTLFFADGQVTNFIDVPIYEDCLVESNETFFVALTNPIAGSLGNPAAVMVTIVDNDTPAGMLGFSTPLAPSLIEGFFGDTLTIHVSRSCGSSGNVSVRYRAYNGFDPCPGTTNAEYGVDYTMSGANAIGVGTLTWNAGDTDDKTFTITITDDTFTELDEVIALEISNPAGGATIDSARSILLLTILSPDPPAGAADPVYNFVTPDNPMPGANNTVYAVGVYPPNRYSASNGVPAIIAGDFTGVNGWERNRIARLTPYGDIDFSFDANAGADGSVSAVAVQCDGKVIVGGSFSSIDNISRNGIARLNADGSLDLSFDPGAGADGPIYAVALQGDGRVVVAGDFTMMRGVPLSRIARLNDDGSLDPTFIPGAGADGPIYAVALDADASVPFSLFISPGSGSATNVFDLGASCGNLTFSFTSLDNKTNAVSLYLTDGSGFGAMFLYQRTTTGNFTVSLPYGGGVNPAATRLMVVVNAGNPINSRWTYSGTANPFPGGPVRAMVVGGDFNTFDGEPRGKVALLGANGALDPAFAPISGADNTVYAAAIQPNRNILIGGSFASFDGDSRNGIARLDIYGLVDPAFNPGTGFNGAVYAIALQRDGRPLLGGEFTSFNGTARTNLARLNLDGTLDTYFLDNYYNQDQPGPDGFVTALGVQPDGSVLIGGSFSRVGGGYFVHDVAQRFNYARVIGGNTQPAGNAPGNIQFVSASYSAGENGGVVTLVLERINGSLGSLQVDYTTVDGSAVANVDYTPASGQLEWMDCIDTNKTINIPILDNQIVQGNRSFYVRISHPVGLGPITNGPALGFQTVAEVTIVDNDFDHGVVGFAAPYFTVDENAGKAHITVTRTNGSTGLVTVQVATSDGSATAPADYAGVTNLTLRFDQNVTSKTFDIDIRNDIASEFEETVNLRLYNVQGGATLGASNATLLIFDNENGRGSLGFATNEFTVNESAGVAEITIRRTSGSYEKVMVDVFTSDPPPGPGAARDGVDYIGTNVTVIFPNGVTSRTITIPIISDRLVEGDEIINLTLTNAQDGANLGFLSHATLRIVDDDAYGSLAFSNPDYYVNERDGEVVITVARTGGNVEEVSADFTVTAGTATDGADFVSTNGTLIFGDGVTAQTIRIPILDDLLLEPNETVQLSLFNFAKATPGAVTNAVLTIIDDEALNVPAGSVDTLFDPGLGPNDFVTAIGVQNDGKLMIAGEFTTCSGVSRRRIARLNFDASLDLSFNPASGADGTIHALIVQPDQKILVAGRFTRMGIRNRNGIARLTQSGTVDTSFNPGAGADNPVFALALQSDGKVIIGGDFTSFKDIERSRVARLTANGDLDATFLPGTGANAPVYVAAVQPDGKILLGGDFTSFRDQPVLFLVRLNPNGSLDPSFRITSGPNESVRSIAIQPDGKLVIGGFFTQVGGVNRSHIARLNPDGTLDTTFNPGPGADGSVDALALQHDGKILAVGKFTAMGGLPRNRIARLLPGGALDMGINFGTGADNYILAVALQPDEQIVIGGGFTIVNGLPRNHIARLVGGADEGAGVFEFSAPAYSVIESGTNVTIAVVRSGGSAGQVELDLMTADGTAVAGADYAGRTNHLVFLDGQTVTNISIPIVNDPLVEPDETFSLTITNITGDGVFGPVAEATVTILNDDAQVGFSLSTYTVGEGVIGGQAIISVDRIGTTNGTVTVDFATVAGTAMTNADYYSTNGTLIFAPGETNHIFAVQVLEDLIVEGPETVGLILSNVTGDAVLGQSNATMIIIDNDFSPGVLTFTAVAYSFSEGVGTAQITLLRTNGATRVVSVDYATADGTATAGADYTPSSGRVTFADGETNQTISIPITQDMLVEGNETFTLQIFNPLGGAVISGPTAVIVTIEDDEFGPGSLDPTFSPGAGADNFVRALAVQPDGKVLIGGAFTNVNGWPHGSIARFHAGGELDTNFNPMANGLVTAVATQVNGKVVIAGNFSQVNGTNRNRVAQLLDSGALDLALADPSGLNAAIYAMVAQPDEKVILGGGFSAPVPGVARLRSSGAVDTSFSPGTGANGAVFALTQLPDGKVVIGGDFLQVNNLARSRVARLDADGPIDESFVPTPVSGGAVRTLVVQPDGRTIIAGDFTMVGTNACNRIARLNVDGSLDTSFGAGLGPNGTVYALALQPDGKVVLGGAFVAVNGTNRFRIARLQADGSLDLAFDPGRGADNTVYAVALLPDGKVMIGGSFTMVNGFLRRGVARLNGDEAPLRLQDPRWAGGQFTLLVTCQPGRRYAFEASTDLVNWLVLGTNTAAGASLTLQDPNAALFNQRFYRVRPVTP